MYKCRNCGARFEEPAVAFERHGLSEGPYESIEVCPYCKVSGMLVEHIESDSEEV